MMASTHDAKKTQSDSDTSNDVSCEDMCAIAGKRYKAGKGAGKKRPSGPGAWHRGKEADEWTSGRREDGGSKVSKLDWYAVRTPEGFVRKSTWQVADVRRPPVSASHIIQCGSDLFIGKEKAYIMNRKKETSVLRNEGAVFVLDLFVKVPSGGVAPTKHKPMEGDAINKGCRWKRAKETSDVRLQQTNFSIAGGVSVEDKSKRNRKTTIW